MTITGQNFDIYQGDNKQLVITVRDDNGALLDLTGYGAVWVAYNQTLDNTVIVKSTGIAGGVTIPTPGNGEIIIELEQVDTESLIPKNYGHQCEIEDSGGNHSTVTTGYVKVLKSITHTQL